MSTLKTTSDIVIDDCVFCYCSSQSSGGGISSTGKSLTIVSSIFYRNFANGHGADVYLSSNSQNCEISRICTCNFTNVHSHTGKSLMIQGSANSIVNFSSIHTSGTELGYDSLYIKSVQQKTSSFNESNCACKSWGSFSYNCQTNCIISGFLFHNCSSPSILKEYSTTPSSHSFEFIFFVGNRASNMITSNANMFYYNCIFYGNTGSLGHSTQKMINCQIDPTVLPPISLTVLQTVLCGNGVIIHSKNRKRIIETHIIHYFMIITL